MPRPCAARHRGGLGEISADDVASVADLDLSGLELGQSAISARHDQRDEGCLFIDDHTAHHGTAVLAHARDLFELALLERGNSLGADHAAVGDNANAADT